MAKMAQWSQERWADWLASFTHCDTSVLQHWFHCNQNYRNYKKKSWGFLLILLILSFRSFLFLLYFFSIPFLTVTINPFPNALAFQLFSFSTFHSGLQFLWSKSSALTKPFQDFHSYPLTSVRNVRPECFFFFFWFLFFENGEVLTSQCGEQTMYNKTIVFLWYILDSTVWPIHLLNQFKMQSICSNDFVFVSGNMLMFLLLSH